MIQNIQLILSQADETEEQRATRLEEIAAGTQLDPVSLLDLEDDLRNELLKQARANPEKMERLDSLISQYAPMMGMDPEDVDAESLINLITIYLLQDPEKTAKTTLTVHKILERNAIYEQLEIDDDL